MRVCVGASVEVGYLVDKPSVSSLCVALKIKFPLCTLNWVKAAALCFQASKVARGSIL